MELRIQLLRGADTVTERLQQDGWKLEAETPQLLSACHPEVANEPEARQRLHRLRLLTSRALQIAFPVVPEVTPGDRGNE